MKENFEGDITFETHYSLLRDWQKWTKFFHIQVVMNAGSGPKTKIPDPYPAKKGPNPCPDQQLCFYRETRKVT
jgi:hypothetical protein